MRPNPLRGVSEEEMVRRLFPNYSPWPARFAQLGFKVVSKSVELVNYDNDVALHIGTLCPCGEKLRHVYVLDYVRIQMQGLPRDGYELFRGEFTEKHLREVDGFTDEQIEQIRDVARSNGTTLETR